MSYEFKYDEAKNRLAIKVIHIDESNADQHIEDFKAVLATVKPGFTGYTDVTDAKAVLSQEMVAKLAPTMDMAIERGLNPNKKWAYVSGNPIYKMQWRRMFGDAVEHFSSCEEADAYLDK